MNLPSLMFLEYCDCSSIFHTVSLVFAMLCANRKFRMRSYQRSQACFLLCLWNTFQLFIWIKHLLHCVPHFLQKPLMCSSRYAGFKGILLYLSTLSQSLLQRDLVIPELDYFCVLYSVAIWHDSQISFLPASLSPQESEICSLTKRGTNFSCSWTFRLMSSRGESEQLQLQGSLSTLTRISPWQSSFYWLPWCWQEQRDFEQTVDIFKKKRFWVALCPAWYSKSL